MKPVREPRRMAAERAASGDRQAAASVPGRPGFFRNARRSDQRSGSDLWLALIGGGRILGPTGDYSKLAGFPLHDFFGEGPGASPVYVLAGFENVGTRLDVALSGGAAVTWTPAIEPPSMQGIRQAYMPAAPGSALLSFRIGDQPSYTVATLASPNRGMLVTLTLDEDGKPRIGQYLLPIGHLIDRLPLEVAQQVRRRNHLRDVLFIAQASRAFRRRRDVQKEVPADELMDCSTPSGSTRSAPRSPPTRRCVAAAGTSCARWSAT